MFHYIYKVMSPSGKYYCGRHSTNNLNDGYVGSGKWVRSVKNKDKLIKEIIGFAASFEELLLLEEKLISEHINDSLCMNFHNSACGWGSGDHNHNTSPEKREIARHRMQLNNPMKGKSHTVETKRLISEAVKGEKNPFFGKKHTEETRLKMRKPKNICDPEAYSKIRSAAAKLALKNGNIVPSFSGRKHTKESKKKLKESLSKVPMVMCEHCGKLMKPQSYKRWHGNNCKQLGY